MAHIAFLGLGAMGSRMAARLVAQGLPVTVWNRSSSAAQALVKQGARSAATPREAVDGADLVISMVTDDGAAHKVWLDAGSGAVQALKAGAVAIECSTVTPTWIATLEKAVARRGGQLLDAPVAGSLPQAAAGQLVWIVGGDAHALEVAKPTLCAMGAKVLHVGASGQGAVLKLAVNALFAAQLASLAELLGFLTRNGYAAEAAAQLLGEFPIVAPALANMVKMMSAQNTTASFTIDLMEKDLGYLLAIAASSGAKLPGATQSHTTFKSAQSNGLGASNVTELAQSFC